MKNQLNFKISSALKDIIGRDLITDEYIAVFELVKNSFDAHASRVDIIFSNIYSGHGKIIIKDNGKGMSLNDLTDRWLFVAYSAKRHGTEDKGYDDYREHINTSRRFAGAKGIGRFSCDKLGKRLLLETTNIFEDSTTEVLLTDWEKFEKNLQDEFIDISVLHETIEKSNYNVKHGTVLEISDLRTNWNREKLLKLKDSLSKLINPSKNKGNTEFSIYISVEEELAKDKEYNNYFQKVNGKVQNFIFETLGLKTTQIHTSISKDGDVVTTELRDGGMLIYKIKEPNKFYFIENGNTIKLNNINYSLYYLNKSAKQTFARRMGLSSINYGHVFLYRNGFRVYPYGDPGEDSFKVDARKSQGYSRFLGTRDLIGQIEIFSEKDTDEIKETTSRGDGLIKTTTYNLIESCFVDVLKKLEKYVVEIQKWGLSIEDTPSLDMQNRMADFIAKISGANEVIDFELADNFFEVMETAQADSAEVIVNNLNRIAIESGNDKLIEQARKATGKLRQIKKAKEEAELQTEEENRKAVIATEKLRQQIGENLFLKSISTTDFKEVISLLHHIGIYAGTIDNNLRGISLRLQNNIPLSTKEISDIIRLISFETKKIINIAAFATKAKFNLLTESIEVDIINYMAEYVKNIIPTTIEKSLIIDIFIEFKGEYMRLIKPIELNIIIDNIISNAKKAKAKKIIIKFSENENHFLEVKFIDDGIGIESDNISRVFDFGYTTTDGSGIGLYHVKQIMTSLKGNTKIENNKPQEGITFTLEFK